MTSVLTGIPEAIERNTIKLTYTLSRFPPDKRLTLLVIYISLAEDINFGTIIDMF